MAPTKRRVNCASPWDAPPRQLAYVRVSDVHISSSCFTRLPSRNHASLCDVRGSASSSWWNLNGGGGEEDGKGEDRHRASQFPMRYSNVRSRFWISFPLYEMCACIDNFVISNSLFSFVVTRLVKANYRMSRFVAGSVGYVPRASRLNKWNRSKCIECWIMWLASIFNNSLKMNFFFTKSYKLCKSMNLIIEHIMY